MNKSQNFRHILAIILTFLISNVLSNCKVTNSDQHTKSVLQDPGQNSSSRIMQLIQANLASEDPIILNKYDVPLNPKDAFSTANCTEAPVIGGPQIFSKYAEMIDNAKTEIFLQTFLWETTDAQLHLDPHTQTITKHDSNHAFELSVPDAHTTIMNALKKRIIEDAPIKNKNEKLTVVILLTGNFAANTSTPTTALLNAQFKNRPYVNFHVVTETFLTANAIHSKSLIVDGEKALLTGANIQGNYDNLTSWYDIGIPLEGPVAGSLRKEFLDAVMTAQEEKKGNAATNDLKDDAAREAQLKKFPEQNTGISWTKPQKACDPTKTKAISTNIPMIITGRRSTALDLLHPNADSNSQNRAYLTAIKNAQTIIKIQTPNLNTPSVMEALITRILEVPRLTVQIILSKGFNDSSEWALGGTNVKTVYNLYKKLRERAPTHLSVRERNELIKRLDIRWFYDPRWNSFIGENYKIYSDIVDFSPIIKANGLVEDFINYPVIPFNYTGGPLYKKDTFRPFNSHAKYMSIDNHILIIGSANMDTQSWYRSREVNVVLDDTVTTARYETDIFDKNFRNSNNSKACKFIEALFAEPGEEKEIAVVCEKE